jgi:hypothetical protein
MQDPIAISAFALSSRSERRDCHVALSNRQKNQGQPSDGQTVTAYAILCGASVRI